MKYSKTILLSPIELLVGRAKPIAVLDGLPISKLTKDDTVTSDRGILWQYLLPMIVICIAIGYFIRVFSV